MDSAIVPDFIYTITFGNIMTIVGFVISIWVTAARLYTLLEKRLVIFEHLLEMHAKTLGEHAKRMERQDELLIRLVGDVQRLIGRVE
jgi:hypothetical protein